MVASLRQAYHNERLACFGEQELDCRRGDGSTEGEWESSLRIVCDCGFRCLGEHFYINLHIMTKGMT